MVYQLRKCLHLYHYYKYPLFGLMHTQTQIRWPAIMKNARKDYASNTPSTPIPSRCTTKEDAGGYILRVETTINDPFDLKGLRPKEGGEPGDIALRPLLKGVADWERRAKVSQRANERYLDALSHLDREISLGQLLSSVTKRIRRGGRAFRALRPWDAVDLPLLQAINRPEHLLSGFHNVDISAILFPRDLANIHTKRAATERTSYRLRLLRAHGLIAKIPRSQRYRTTKKGRQLCAAILLAQTDTVKQLNAKAS